MKSIALYYSMNRISGSLFSADSHVVQATIQSAVVVEVEQSRMKIAAATKKTVDNTLPVPYGEVGEKAATNTELHLNVWKVEAVSGDRFMTQADSGGRYLPPRADGLPCSLNDSSAYTC